MIVHYHGSEAQVAELYDNYRDFELIVDSRRVTDPGRTLFFALAGARTDGHGFIPALLERGVRHFVARTQVQSGDENQARPPRDGTFLICAEPLTILQDLAAHHRRQFKIPVLAITGSNGKTIVKDWLAGVLGKQYRVCASPRSYNSQIGVPLSVWGLREEHELAIFEAGVSQSGEMERLARIIRPTCGIFTVLGSAHAAGFPDEATKHQEKIKLFAGAEWVAVSADDNASIGLLRKLDVEPVRHLVFGRHLVEVDERGIEVRLPDLPAIYLENAAAVVAAAYALGVEPLRIRAAVQDLQVLSNRLEVRAGLYGGVVINDSYSNDLSALAAALDFAVGQDPKGRVTLVLGTLQPAPLSLLRTRDRALKNLLNDRVTRLITVGEAMKEVTAARHFNTTDSLLEALPELRFKDETILVKGASYEGLHRVADALSRRQHRTLLRLDLTALAHNFGVYQSRVTAGLIVMVKASAYGGGALPVARTLAAAGAAYLAVAYPDEGRELRAGGLTTPILVLNAEPYTFPLLVEDGLEPVVHDLNGLRRAREYGLRAHLEIDTGMGRLGFANGAVSGLLDELGAAYQATVASVFSHLAASDDPRQDGFTNQQIDLFFEAYNLIEDRLGSSPPRHLLNTNGISRFPRFDFEYVRLGIGLYGIGDATLAGELRPVLRFTTRVSQVYDRPAGDTVGYNRRGKLTRDARIAVLSIGYADGLPRLAGEGRFSVRFREGLAPVIGSVCMDMTMVDVTDLPTVKVGDEATIFGAEHPIELLAAAAQTIPYEVLTGIGPRVHRIYSTE